MERIQREYNYSDVYLVPNKCIVNSRSECDTSIMLGKHKFIMPLIAANMKSVVNEETCEFFSKHGWFYIMHRYGIDQVKFIDRMQQQGYVASISVGVNEESFNQLKEIKNAKLHPEFITVDIAYIFSPKGEKMIKYIRENYPESFLIAGNMTTAEAVVEVTSWGAMACKLFVGPGHACTTKLASGFTRPTISTLLECSKFASVPLIADGGITVPGDISKACAAGASLVMAGSIFSGFDQSSTEIITIDGKKVCCYFGSASEFNKTEKKHVEGTKVLIEYKGDMTPYLSYLQESLRSAISYAGGRNLSALLTCRFVAIN